MPCGRRIVSESTLTSHINAARKAIGDSGQNQRLLRTIARKGFRFVGDVNEYRQSLRRGQHRARRTGQNHRRGAGPPRQALNCRAPVPKPKRRHRAGVLHRRRSGSSIITALSRIRWLSR